MEREVTAMRQDKRKVEFLKVDAPVLSALQSARVGDDIVKAAQEAGIMHRAEGRGWTITGQRGDIMTARQERAFDRARSRPPQA